ncbi:hypothetical protein JCM13304A_12720 [Desulfothermus okinawensis JCM 13304]
MRIKITVDYEKIIPFLLDMRQVKICTKKICEFIDVMGEVEIKLTGDLEIEALNREFLKLEGPTNVLSFPGDEEDFLGSICVSIDTIIREANLYCQDTEEYFYRMLIHGILHLCGYGHGDIMYETTDLILERLKGEGLIQG